MDRATYMREWRRRGDNMMKQRESTKRWASKNRLVVQGYAKRNNENNPGNNAARQAVYKAVKSGVIVKSEFCQLCLSGKNIHAHHQDYTKQLDVVWLCAACHVDLHKVGKR